MPHPVMYFEIGCRDVAATRDFYKAMFEWEMNEDKPNYVGLPKGAPHAIGGHIMSLGHEPHQYTLFYVEVEDVTAYCEKAKSLGGKVVVPPVDIGEGKFAWIHDNGGNTVGLWEPSK
jgi:predicted enzyme related to lactoylglutathione lyase